MSSNQFGQPRMSTSLRPQKPNTKIIPIDRHGHSQNRIFKRITPKNKKQKKLTTTTRSRWYLVEVVGSGEKKFLGSDSPAVEPSIVDGALRSFILTNLAEK